MTDNNADATRLSAEEGSLMAEISRVITESPDIQDVYDRFAELVRPILPFDRIDITSIDSDNGTLRSEFVHGVELDAESARRGYMRPLAGSITEEVVDRGSGILFSPGAETDIAEEFPSHVAMHRLGVRSAMTAPLISGGKVMGTLALMSMEAHAYTEEHLRTAERIALQISGAVANAHLLAKQRETEDTLRSRERLFQEMYEEAPIAYTSTDVNGLILNANRRAREMFGYTSEEMLGRHGRDMLADTPSGIGLAPELNERLLAGEELRAVELEFKRANGTSFWGSVSASIVEGPNGEAAAYRSTIQDISARKQAEGELRRVHEHYRTIMDNIEELVSLKDASGRFLLVNKAFASDAGVPKEAIEGGSWADFVPTPELVEDAKRRHQEVMETGRPLDTCIVRDDKRRSYQRRDTPILDAHGRVDRVVTISTDITDRKRTEDALKQSEVNYRALIENMDGAVASKDADGRYVVVNKAFCSLVGLPQEDIIGKTISEIHGDAAFISETDTLDREIIESRRPIRFERREDDGRIIDVHKAPVLDGDGKVTGIVGVAFDVTQLRLAEDQLRRTDETYRLLVDSLDDLFALTRTPRAGICWSIRPMPIGLGCAKRISWANSGRSFARIRRISGQRGVITRR